MINGTLIDADYITRDGKAIVRLWVKSDSRMIKILDPEFEPYFYLIPIDLGSDGEIGEVGGVKSVERAELRNERGENVWVFKVTCSHPSEVPRIRELLRDYGDVREADIPFAIRYIIDRDLEPMGGVEADGEFVRGDELLARRVKRTEIDPPKLNVLAFDTEVYNPKGMPVPEENPIVMISIATEKWTRVLEADGMDDEKAIKNFIEILQEEDPDVIVGYNSNNFDWPYLRKRCEVNSIVLRAGRDGSEVKYGRGVLPRVSITGRGVVDLYRIVDRDLPDIKIKTLENVVDQLGIMKVGERTNIPKDRIFRYWDSEELRQTLKEYTKDDVESTLKLGLELLPMQIELAKLIRALISDVSTMGRGRQVEHYLMTHAYNEGILVPNRGDGGGRGMYEGGLVLSPKPGIHEHVVCLDFSSMYPSIMIAFNVSPDTLLVGGKEEYYEAPGVGHRFRKSPDGFFKKILVELVSRRKEIKREMKELASDSMKYRLLDMRQRTVKVLTNSFYGYTGWSVARWYKRECAEATSAWGRHFIKQAISKTEGEGIEVLYGDTDSLFVKGSDYIPKLVQEINDEVPVELEIEEKYEEIFFTGKKKRYAGLTVGGDLIIKGLEVKRGDWCELAKRTQQETIDTILRKKDVNEAVENVKRTIKRLKDGKFALDELTIHKGLMKPIASYKSQQAHVRAAKKAMEEGLAPGLGSKISFVVTKGSGSMSERSKVVKLVKDKGEVDINYYIDNQVVPTALRMLELFGYSPEDLKGEAKQFTLDKF